MSPADGPNFAYLCGVKKSGLILAFLAIVCAGLGAQTPKGYPMYYQVEGNDTTFYDTLDPIWVFPRGRGFKKNGDWRREYKLIYNFNKVYPYALVGRKMMAQVDSTLAADVSKRSQRNQYINQVERELLALFTKDIKQMTTTQGFVLMRLIDRECGLSAYEIIKEYESGFAANFWQVIAKLFSHDLKIRYDPKGRDAKLEELVSIWDSGQWDQFYYSVFFEPPRKTVIKTDRLQSEVKDKNKPKDGGTRKPKRQRQG